MRQQTGYEDDWINALNAAGNLANTLSQTSAKGLQTEAYQKDLNDKRRKEAIANTMTTGLSRGASPDELAKTTSVPGAGDGWKEDYQKVNAGLQPGDRDYVTETGFTRSSDVVGSAEVQAGLNESLRQRAEMFKNSEDAKTDEAYKQLSNIPIDKLLASNEVKTGDYSGHGENASAMARAYARVLSEYSKVPEVAKKINEDRAALVNNLYSEFQSRMGLASEYFKKGMRDEGKNVLRDIVDKSILAYKTDETPDGKIKLKVTTAGEDSVSDKAYEPEELFSELLKIGQREFASNTFAAMEHKRQLNEGKVEYLVDQKGNVLTAKPMFDIKSNDNRWYVTINGRQVGRANLEDFITEYGFKNVKNKELEDAGTRRGLAIQGDRVSIENARKEGRLRDEQIKNEQGKAAGLSRKVTPEMLKYFGKEFNKNVVSKMAGAGAMITEDDMGILRSSRPLDEKQKIMIENIGSQKGVTAVTYPNSEGGYDFHGFVPTEAVPMSSQDDVHGGDYVRNNLKSLNGDTQDKSKSRKNSIVKPLPEGSSTPPLVKAYRAIDKFITPSEKEKKDISEYKAKRKAAEAKKDKHARGIYNSTL